MGVCAAQLNCGEKKLEETVDYVASSLALLKARPNDVIPFGSPDFDHTLYGKVSRNKVYT